MYTHACLWYRYVYMHGCMFIEALMAVEYKGNIHPGTCTIINTPAQEELYTIETSYSS